MIKEQLFHIPVYLFIMLILFAANAEISTYITLAVGYVLGIAIGLKIVRVFKLGGE